MLDESTKWKALPSMPKPDSHIECSWVIVNNSIVIVGGTTEKHPVTKRMILVGEVFQFNLNTLVFTFSIHCKQSSFILNCIISFHHRAFTTLFHCLQFEILHHLFPYLILLVTEIVFCFTTCIDMVCHRKDAI